MGTVVEGAVVQGIVVGMTVGATVVVVVSGPTGMVSADCWSVLAKTFVATTFVAADRASTVAIAMTPTRATGE
tara:strand:- start:1776 stop:1994 length:219 start_codon:yes stop_codon:yes gene_type:complete